MITIYNGDTVDINISVQDNNIGFDLTGYTCSFIIKHSVNSSLVYANIEHDAIKSDLVNGMLVFLIDKVLTDKLPVGKHRYSVIIEKIDFRKTVRIGEFKIMESLHVPEDPSGVYPLR